MKNPSRPRPSLLLALVLAAVPAFAAVTPTEWASRQAVTVTAPGLSRLALPAATFDAAQPSLADLRLLDPAGQELPYLLDRPPAPEAERDPVRAPASFRATRQGDTTQLLIATGTNERLDTLELQTSVPFFLKAAHVELSADGTTWESLGAAVPVFRQFGAEQLRLDLGRKRATLLRVTIDDFRSRPIEFTGAALCPTPARAELPPLAPLGARITRRDEFAGETVLTVTLDGRHVRLAALVFDAADPLFMRHVTVAIREVQGAVSGERTIAAGTLYRVAIDGAPIRAELELPVDFVPPTRELLVHLRNGDSPPLTIAGLQARQHPVNLLFLAPAAGRYTLLSGNAQAAAPRYDLAAFAGDLRTATTVAASAGELEAMPDYRPRESLGTAPLPDVPLAGAPLDTHDWREQRTLKLAQAGVQELELDPAALARARPDFGDLRLLRGGNQIPYVLEQPALFRSLALPPTVVPDAKRPPAVSLWRITLPQAGLPVRRLVLTSATPLFQRQFRIYEQRTDRDGATYAAVLAEGAWSRTPEPGVPETRTFELSERPRGDTLFLETNNGDNPAIVLGPVQAVHPVARLVFKTAETDGFTLAYGNTAVAAPRYDLSLVAVKLLTAARNVATFAEAATPAPAAATLGGLKVGVYFWTALGLVVVVLLVVVAKLLPKPPAA